MTASGQSRTTLALVAAMVVLCGTAKAADLRTRADQRGTWSFVTENDVFGGTDRNYTNGVRLGYLTGFRPVEGISGFAARTLLGADPEDGLDDQLNDEPGILIGYNKKLRNLIETSTLGLGADLAPDVGFSLGNVLTEASADLTLRVGTDLGGDYGPPRIRPSLAGAGFFAPAGAFSAYLFAGVQGRAVARNIFLDGNSFEDSPSVDKKHFVADVQAGVVVQFKDVHLAYTFVTRTKEFDTQDDRQTFVAISVSFNF